MKIFHLISTQKIVKKMKKMKNHVLEFPFFLLMKKIQLDVKPAKNANDDYVGDDDIFVNIFYIFEHDNDVIKLCLSFLK